MARKMLRMRAKRRREGKGTTRRLNWTGMVGDRWGFRKDRNTDARTRTHPVVVKHAPANLLEDVARRALERLLDILARLRARLDEQQALLLRPQFALVR